jgi:hypothetical protein
VKYRPIVSTVQGTNAYLTQANCTILAGQEPAGRNGELRWHLSIAHPKRYPSWKEIMEARYDLLPPEVTIAMILPPPEEYINVHKNCFHLWEIEPEEAAA